MPNLIPQDIREWMRRIEFKTNDLTRRMSSLIPGDIAEGVDLDGYKSTGRWRKPSTSGTTTTLHYPFNGASGTLEVYWEPTNPQVHQIWYDRSGSIWTRWWNNVAWSAWLASGASVPVAIAAGTDYTSAATSEFDGPGVIRLSGDLVKSAVPLVRGVTIGTVTLAHRPSVLRRGVVALGTATPPGSGASGIQITTAGAIVLTANSADLAGLIRVFVDGVTYKI